MKKHWFAIVYLILLCSICYSANDRNAKSVVLDKAVSLKEWELKIKGSRFAKELVLENQPDFYEESFYLKGDDVIYLILTIEAKNISKKELDFTNLPDFRARYDNKYGYKSLKVLERNDFFEISAVVSPSNTEKVHYLFEMPKVSESDGKPLKIEFVDNNILYEFKIR